MLALGQATYTACMFVQYGVGPVTSTTEEALANESRADPAFFWTIVLLDLGVVVPGAIATALAVRHDGARWLDSRHSPGPLSARYSPAALVGRWR